MHVGHVKARRCIYKKNTYNFISKLNVTLRNELLYVIANEISPNIISLSNPTLVAHGPGNSCR